jgi:SRSO17 transposase
VEFGKLPLIIYYVALTLDSSAIFQNNEGQFHIMAYASKLGHTLLDRELYLPLRWTQDPERCREAGIPASVGFQTKCELAQKMLERIFHAQIPAAWVVADSVYGGNPDLRT